MTTRTYGFSIVELLVALAVMAVLGALVVPAIVSAVDRARVDSAVESLESIAEAIDLFQERVGRRPRTMTQLVIPITTADNHFCGALLGGAQSTYNGGEVGRWSGPYLNRSIPPAGVPIGIGTVANVFTRRIDPSGIDYLQPVVQNVLTEDARGLDRAVDDGDGMSSGTLRWDSPVNGFTTVYYLVPFRDC